MTRRQKLLAKQGKLETEKRGLQNTIGEIALADGEPSEEQRAEVRKAQERIIAINGELDTVTAAMGDEPEDRFETVSPETAEFDRLVRSFSIGQVAHAATEHRATAGETAELQQHYRLAGNEFPLDLLRGAHSPAASVEHRAVTPAPGNTGRTQGDILQPVFAGGAADYLAVFQPIVEAGDAVYPVLTTRPTVGGPHSDSTNVDETTGAFGAEALQPKRLQASFFYRRVDAARFASMSESLRMALASGLSEANDQEVVDQIVTDVARTDAAATEESYSSYLSRLMYDQVDGRFAGSEADIRVMVGSATFAHMGSKFKAASGDVTAIQALRSAGAGLRVSALIAGVANNLQDAIVRKGTRADMIAPVWRGVALIVDEVTKAGTGEIVMTAVALSDRKVIRTGGFARIQVRHSA